MTSYFGSEKPCFKSVRSTRGLSLAGMLLALFCGGVLVISGCQEESAPASDSKRANANFTSVNATDISATNAGSTNADVPNANPVDAGTASSNAANADIANTNAADTRAAGSNAANATGHSGDQGKANQAGDNQGDNQDEANQPPPIKWDDPVAVPPEAAGMEKPDPESDMWWDPKNKKIVLGGRICKQKGYLELFATLRGGKEHESIVTFRTQASRVHAMLLAMGINNGEPVTYRPEFKPATGPEIEVTVFWTDKDGARQSNRAQEWIRKSGTEKEILSYPWVFGGSYFSDDGNGGQFYMADAAGEFICVSNFRSAMLDLPVQSSDANAELLFECFTQRIPAEGTEVAVVLTPKAPPADDAAKKADGDGK